MPITPEQKAEVAAKLAAYTKEAHRGSGLFYELYSQRYTDFVDGLIRRTRDEELAKYILQEAQKSGDYNEDEQKGRWVYDIEANDITFVGGEEP